MAFVPLLVSARSVGDRSTGAACADIAERQSISSGGRVHVMSNHISLDEIMAQAEADETNAAACALQPQPVETPPGCAPLSPNEVRRRIAACDAKSATDAAAGAAGVDAALAAVDVACGADTAKAAGGFAAVADTEKDTEKYKAFEAADIQFEDAADFMAKQLPPFDWIVPDLIAVAGGKGFKGDLFGKSKTSKTWLALQLAHCVATGRKFLSWDIPRPRNVVYFNLELFPTGEQERMTDQQAALRINSEELRDRLFVVNLRNRGHELRKHIEAIVAELRRRKIDLAVIDPRYKLVADGEDENTAAGLRGVLNFRDAISEVCAVLVVGHDPKGEVGDKSITDRGAGSYTAGADFDFCLALSPHEEDGYTVLSASSRYRSSPEDMTLSWDGQGGKVFRIESSIPAVKRTGRPHGGTSENTLRSRVVAVLKEKPNYRAGLVKAGFNLDSPVGRKVWKSITDTPSTFGLVSVPVVGTKMTYYGTSPETERVAEIAATGYKNCQEAQK